MEDVERDIWADWRAAVAKVAAERARFRHLCGVHGGHDEDKCPRCEAEDREAFAKVRAEDRAIAARELGPEDAYDYGVRR